MANSDRPNGLKPVKHSNGNPWNGAVNQYYVPAADTFAMAVGDPVKLGSTASTDGYPTILKVAATTDPLVGVIVGFRVDPTDLNITGSYRAASTARYVLVADDPDVIFEAQEDGNMGLVGTNLNFPYVDAGVNTSTGTSGVEIDSSEATTLNTAQFQVIGFKDAVDNDPTAANAKVLVRINLHAKRGATGAAGVA